MERKETRKVLNLKELERRDLAYALNVVADIMKRRLSDEEVRELYAQGLPISFKGGAPSHSSEENYVLSYEPRKEDMPRLRVNCLFSVSGDHRQLMKRGRPIVAGILNKGRFSSYSSTWMKEALCGNPTYTFGENINRVMLSHFGLK